jgi:hypothetical protein
MAIISIKFEGKALKKLVEAVENGIGGWFLPYQVVRLAKADAKAKLIAAQAEKDVAQINDDLKRLDEFGELVALENEVLPPLIEAAKPGDYVGFAVAAETDRAIQRTRNLVSIVRKAAEEAGETPDEQVSDQPVDPDWFARWRSGAEDVSSEQMQQLWARILAGEVREPGKFSLRVLDFLRSLSASEASDIAKLGSFIIDGDAIYRDDSVKPILERAGITTPTTVVLRDLGIIGEIGIFSGLEMKWKSSQLDTFLVVIGCQEKALLCTHSDASKTLTIPIATVSRLGRDLLSLVHDARANVDYLRGLGTSIKEKGFRVSLADRRRKKDHWAFTNHIEL